MINFKLKNMRTRLQFLLLTLLICGFFNGAYAQINYSEDFEDFDGSWEGTNDLFAETIYSCNGTTAFYTNLYFDPFWGEGILEATTVTPSIGMSNGGQVTLSYNYKLLNYGNPPTVATSSSDWGVIEVSYATSPAGPYTLLQTITPQNHVSSTSCAAKTVTFYPPAGQQVYLKFYGELGNMANDFLFIFDDVVATQAAPISCAGTPAASAAVSSSTQVCTSQNFSLSLSPAYTNIGLTYQWQSSNDGTTFTNVATGGTTQIYSTLTTTDKWYRAIITCTASGQSVTSAPIEVESTGAPCYCDIEFAEDIEPITLVNFAGINNTTSATLNGSPGVENFTALAPAQVVVGQTYPITVKGNTAGNFDTHYMLYIDFNHNGNLSDPGESFQIGIITNSTGLDALQATANIAIPATAMTGQTRMRVLKLFTDYAVDPCSSEIGLGYGQAEDYTINITGTCTTIAPTAIATQEFCSNSNSTVANLNATGTGTIVWYAEATGGTALAATTPLVNNETYYAAQIIGCESIARTQVTAAIITVAVDTFDDVVACTDYTLETLDSGNYYTEPDGAGDQLEAGDVIDETMTIYVYNVSGECSAESSFTVTVSAVTVDELDDVEVCESYILPELTNGSYYTEANGGGLELAAGDEIEENATIYIYAESGTTPNCTAESSFIVTITEVADLSGAAQQAIETAGTIGDLEVTGEDGAIISWYATEENAEEGIDPLDPSTILVDGATYYASQLVGECTSDAFAVTVDIIILGVKGFNANALSYYPNPVKDVLTLSYNNTITSVEVYNFLGQQIMQKTINLNEAKLDMSQLAAGTYMVKLNTENGSTAVKVLKQ